MYLQEILEVAIGLVFVWLVMSVAAMTIQEWLSNALKWRPKALHGAIQQMIASNNLAMQLYQHPLITGLSATPQKAGKKMRLPSYMPAGKFSLALIDLITKAGLDASPIVQASPAVNDKLDETLAGPEQRKVATSDWKAVLDTAHQAATSQASLDSLKSQVQIFGEKYPEVQPLLAGIQPKLDAFYQPYLTRASSGASVPEAQVAMNKFHLGLNAIKQNPDHGSAGETIGTVLRSVELMGTMTVAQTRVHLETWFNDAMDRLSGVYKRRSQFMAFLIGTFLALLMNVDSINVATSLWREPTLRQTIIAEAQSYNLPATTGTTTSPLQSIPQMQKQLQVLNIPFGWTLAVFDTGGRKCSLFPVGNVIWGFPSRDSSGVPVCKEFNNIPLDPYGWAMKLLGMLITGAAAAQGAPFWFDVLKKMVNVRSSGPNPSEQTPVG
jgi:hypothetical protein